MIQKGQAIPTGTLSELGEEGMVTHNTEELFANKRVVLLLFQAHLRQPVQKLIYLVTLYLPMTLRQKVSILSRVFQSTMLLSCKRGEKHKMPRKS